jgi:hypothetical protein
MKKSLAKAKLFFSYVDIHNKVSYVNLHRWMTLIKNNGGA